MYTGFPTGSPEELQIILSDAGDVGGRLTITYLATSGSTAYQTATITTTGTTHNTGITAYRMHTASFASGTATTFKLGTVTVRHRTTTANVFCVMPIGNSQTYVSGYTVPYGSRAFVKRLFCRVFANVSGSVEGALWVRTLGGSPRLRRPFSAANTDFFEENPYGGLELSQGTDVIVRITAASVNNLSVIGGYDLVVIKNGESLFL